MVDQRGNKMSLEENYKYEKKENKLKIINKLKEHILLWGLYSEKTSYSQGLGTFICVYRRWWPPLGRKLLIEISLNNNQVQVYSRDYKTLAEQLVSILKNRDSIQNE